ncbi:redoxin domain-containing protein [Kribbella sp. NPDC051137]|uniref:redoxin domain-containing protein n=1 Tax=Kribbella sp. NPDC051137 TaxID=3155045 RepID=UPI0034453E1A
MPLLNEGDQFPSLVVDRVGGGEIVLPDDLRGQYGVVLFNRGSWCPFCVTQLKGFTRALPDLDAVGAAVVSISADPKDDASTMVDSHSIAFPVGYGASPARLAELTGAFVHEGPSYVQATGFILDPDGRVLLSTYSTGAVGRLNAPDAVGFIKYVQSSS